MAGNPQVLGLLEEMLDSGRTPEEVCRDCPELLPEVRRRWQEFRLIDAQGTLALARLYSDAFAADPRLAGDLVAGHRYGAARAAARAGCGRGTDATGLGEEQRRRWRERARRWLREDLAAREKTLGGTAAGRLWAAQAVKRWRSDADLAGLRAPPELARLPADERRDCLALWAEADDLVTRFGGTAPKR